MARTRAFQVGQDTQPALIADHLTVMVNPETGSAAMLLNDGPRCAFGTVGAVLQPHTPPMESALDFLRLAR